MYIWRRSSGGAEPSYKYVEQLMHGAFLVHPRKASISCCARIDVDSGYLDMIETESNYGPRCSNQWHEQLFRWACTYRIELVSEVSAPLSVAKWCDDTRNNI